jgi:hypothetical protein
MYLVQILVLVYLLVSPRGGAVLIGTLQKRVADDESVMPTAFIARLTPAQTGCLRVG